MKHYSAKKLALAGMFCAVAVVGSVFSFPVFGSKCAPVQHMVNILCAVLLGPYYGVGVAFVASLLRNLLGLGLSLIHILLAGADCQQEEDAALFVAIAEAVGDIIIFRVVALVGIADVVHHLSLIHIL